MSNPFEGQSWDGMMEDTEQAVRTLGAIYERLVRLAAEAKLGRNLQDMEMLLNKTIPATETDRRLQFFMIFLARGRRGALIEFLFKTRRACLLLLVDGAAVATALGATDELDIQQKEDGWFHVTVLSRDRAPLPPAAARVSAETHKRRERRPQNRGRRSPRGGGAPPVMDMAECQRLIASFDASEGVALATPTYLDKVRGVKSASPGSVPRNGKSTVPKVLLKEEPKVLLKEEPKVLLKEESKPAPELVSVVEAIIETAAASAAEPAPAIVPATETAIVLVAEPAIVTATMTAIVTATETAIVTATETAIVPVTETAPEPAIVAATEPAAETAIVPAAEPAIVPAAEPAIVPAAEPAIVPAAEPATEKAVVSPAKPTWPDLSGRSWADDDDSDWGTLLEEVIRRSPELEKKTAVEVTALATSAASRQGAAPRPSAAPRQAAAPRPSAAAPRPAQKSEGTGAGKRGRRK